MLCFCGTAKQISRKYIYIYSLLFRFFPFRLPQSIEYSSLCYTEGFHKLFILYIVSIAYICQSQSPNSSHLPFPTLVSIHLFSMSGSVFLLCKYHHLCHFTIFLIYTLIYSTGFSLTDFTLYDSR